MKTSTHFENKIHDSVSGAVAFVDNAGRPSCLDCLIERVNVSGPAIVTAVHDEDDPGPVYVPGKAWNWHNLTARAEKPKDEKR
jgi:hypothetical protein